MTWSPPSVGPVWFLSDLHGASPSAYLPRVLPQEVQAVIVVGDVLDGFNTRQGTEDAWEELLDHNPGRIWFIRGNHDCDYHSHVWWTPERDLTGRVLQLDALWIAGIGWTGTKPFQAPKPADHRQVCESIDLVLSQRPPEMKVVVASHYVPNLNPWRRKSPGFAEQFPYVGFEEDALNPWIERWKPSTVVCGHLHEFHGAQGSFEGCTVISSVAPNVAPMRRRSPG